MDIREFGWGRKAIFGVGSVAYGIKDCGFSTFLMTYFYLWNPPAVTGMALFAFLIVAAVIVRLSITFFEVPNSALIGELSHDYDGRTALAGFRLMMGWMGGVFMRSWPMNSICNRQYCSRSAS